MPIFQNIKKKDLVRNVAFYSIFCKCLSRLRKQMEPPVCFHVQSVVISHITSPLVSATLRS